MSIFQTAHDQFVTVKLVVQTKCDFSDLEWPAQGREEESCARVDSAKNRSLPC